MPRKKETSPDAEDFQPELPRDGDAKKQRKPKLYIPINEDGTLDMDPQRLRDKSVLDRARFALGIEGATAIPTENPQVVPREMVPFLYDGLAAVVRIGTTLVKWPRAASPEQRAEIVSYMKYSDEFKKNATEPTANLLDKITGNSKLIAWLARNEDAARLVFLLYQGTTEMFQQAALQFNVAQLQRAQEAAKVPPNGGFPPSENRGPIAVGPTA